VKKPAVTKPPRPVAARAREWAKSLAVALVLWLVLRTFVVEAFRIPSSSMERTLLVGDFLFVTKAVYGAEIPVLHRHLPALREPRRGDIVVFRSVEGNFNVVKRVIGLPGDTLAMRDGQMYRNGLRLSEPYAIHRDSTSSASPEDRARMRAWQVSHVVGRDSVGYRPDVENWGPLLVPLDSLFVMGDNRDDSADSRYWGLLPRANVRGSPLLIYYSYDPSSWRTLPFLTAIRFGRLFSRPR
jgi:signal peptidase I